jgi:hypothetical protein
LILQGLHLQTHVDSVKVIRFVNPKPELPAGSAGD